MKTSTKTLQQRDAPPGGTDEVWAGVESRLRDPLRLLAQMTPAAAKLLLALLVTDREEMTAAEARTLLGKGLQKDETFYRARDQLRALGMWLGGAPAAFPTLRSQAQLDRMHGGRFYEVDESFWVRAIAIDRMPGGQPTFRPDTPFRRKRYALVALVQDVMTYYFEQAHCSRDSAQVLARESEENAERYLNAVQLTLEQAAFKVIESPVAYVMDILQAWRAHGVTGIVARPLPSAQPEVASTTPTLTTLETSAEVNPGPVVRSEVMVPRRPDEGSQSLDVEPGQRYRASAGQARDCHHEHYVPQGDDTVVCKQCGAQFRCTNPASHQRQPNWWTVDGCRLCDGVARERARRASHGAA